MSRAVWLGLLAVACGDPAAPGGIGRVQVALVGTNDTIRFEVPVTATRCAGSAGLLLHGEQRGQGVLVWLRGGGGQLDTATYPLLTRGDAITPRGVIAAVRYMVGEVAHGVTLDDGAATVTRAAPPIDLSIRGRGVEAAMAAQRNAEVELKGVTLGPDTASCRAQP